MRGLLVGLALIVGACAQPARAPSAEEAFAPLIGCWRGTFERAPEGVWDERCFELLNANVVDRHQVHGADYAGEATFHDDDAGGIIFAYAASDGGRSNGAVRAEAGRIVIEPHTHIGGDGQTFRLRGVWILEGPDRFVTETERERDGAWSPYMRIVYTRMAAAAE